MKFGIYSAFLLSIGSAAAAALGQRQETSQCAEQNATTYSFVYGIPLLAFEKAWTQRPQQTVSNHIFNSPRLATPADKQVVKPNVDTLYGGSVFDTSTDNVEITVGEVPSDRYWVMSFYTPFGDNYLNLGALAETPPGTYLLTPANASETSGTLQESSDPAYESVIYSPTTLGYMLLRILLKNSTTDVEVVSEIQKGFSTTPIPRDGEPMGPAVNAELFADNSTNPAEHLITLMTRLQDIVPPALAESGAMTETTTSNLTLAGFSPDGTYSKPSCVNASSAMELAVGSLQMYGTSTAWLEPLGNNWQIPPDDAIGLYHGDYLARSTVAQWAYMAMTSDQALYPKYITQMSLASNESYTLKFSGKPQLTDIGFWSVTMYNAEGYLVENPIDRYSLGDRSNLTYSDGTLVYADAESDGEFEILIQKDTPPSEWTSNWLPSPEGPFDALLRYYAAADALVEGEYTYPVVTKGAAKVENSSPELQEGNADPEGAASSVKPLGIGATLLVALTCALVA